MVNSDRGESDGRDVGLISKEHSMTRTMCCPLCLLVWFLCSPLPAQPPLVMTASVSGEQVGAESRIREALAEPLLDPIGQISLADLVEVLKSRAVPAYLDTRALEDAGIDGDSEVALQVNGIQWKSALNALLRQHGLTWIVRDEMLVITSREQAEAELVTKIYNVTQLTSPRGGQAAEGAMCQGGDHDTLIAVITRTIAPDSWDAVGGPGSIEAAEVGEHSVLLIAQTFAVHDMLEQLLTCLHRFDGPLRGGMRSKVGGLGGGGFFAVPENGKRPY